MTPTRRLSSRAVPPPPFARRASPAVSERIESRARPHARAARPAARRGCARRCATACSAAASGCGPCWSTPPARRSARRPSALDAPAAAVELIHAYSLVHDDLPAMDDDDLRRGRPTCHRAFDEGTAILAGDALQALAFEVLAGAPTADAAAPRRASQHDQRAGARHRHRSAWPAARPSISAPSAGASTPPTLEDMHRRKTGALIEASVLLGALAAGVAQRRRATMRCGATAPRSAWPSRSRTTSSTSPATPRRSARRRRRRRPRQAHLSQHRSGSRPHAGSPPLHRDRRDRGARSRWASAARACCASWRISSSTAAAEPPGGPLPPCRLRA